MSCITCSNCGFVNFLPPESQLHTLADIKSSDSLVLQFLRKSRPLLDDDCALISAEIVELERLRSVYDAQLREIEYHRLPTLKFLENRKSIYAPIRRMPRDILLEIFHSVCDLSRRQDSLKLSNPLWVLARVCRVWRDTLHTSPVSWSRNVSIKSPFSKHAPQILRAYLERTGNHPLSIQIRHFSSHPAEEDEIMFLLLQSCCRWKNLCIYVDTRHAHYLKSISPLPLLQTIEVYIPDDCSEYPSDMCLNAPQLRQATFICHGIHQMRLSPSGITHYSGQIICEEDLLLLSQLPMLKMCHIPDVMIDSIAIPVVMTELRQLYVGELDVLNFLTAPTLQSLDITGEYPGSVSTITHFLHRSGCQLESLSMRMKIFQSELSALISEMLSSEACSAISHLKLVLGAQLVKVANTLTPSSVLPNLHHLVLCMEAVNFQREQTKRLVDMIRSRRDAGLLKMIEVQFGDRYYYHNDDNEDVSEDGDRTLTTFHDVETSVRALINENLDMRVETWNPVDLDLRLLFWDGEVV